MPWPDTPDERRRSVSEPVIADYAASDGFIGKYRRYAPVGEPRGEIVAVHGIQSHGGWYDTSSRMLADRGWGVSFLDRRGSGLNLERRGDCPSFRRLLDDIGEFVHGIDRRPIVLMGVSWGGKLAAAFPRRFPDTVDGLVLVAPGIKPQVKPPALTRMTLLVRRLIQPTRLVPIPLSDPDLFTANPERREFIRTDPLALHRATTRFLIESRRLDVHLRFAARKVRVPTLVLLAGEDRIINNRRTRKFSQRFRGDTTVHEFPGAHHTLEFEPGGPVFVEVLEQWLNRWKA
ncbi:MAG: lysophospholipase [Gemmataceae bacterium]|nr:lysophospholipase [Gemmataceae bacterium]